SSPGSTVVHGRSTSSSTKFPVTLELPPVIVMVAPSLFLRYHMVARDEVFAGAGTAPPMPPPSRQPTLQDPSPACLVVNADAVRRGAAGVATPPSILPSVFMRRLRILAMSSRRPVAEGAG